jgi:hypothetical protein
MKKQLIRLAVATSAASALAFGAAAGPAGAAGGDGGACVRAGIDTLSSLGLLQAAAQRSIDYSTLADPADGPIYADLPAGSFLSLGQVVKLHTTNPELFAWCR